MRRSVEERINRKYGNSFYDLRQVLKILKNLDPELEYTYEDLNDFAGNNIYSESSEMLLGTSYKGVSKRWVKLEWLPNFFGEMGLHYDNSRIKKAIKKSGLNRKVTRTPEHILHRPE